ncbi:uncharacterized protein FIBRA_01797 [Fibroporia radiculosa]|uniref:Uncharacterized protein n=1 Tax=Fibroporia radiculosa TaxID=599839 RepID=J4GLD6_9APHY|nr:uncharacterized protein FIBRA_01797 [Fibroporia radiculosa]CCL99775.1 predicted protein [Fibroporia radiculosa]
MSNDNNTENELPTLDKLLLPKRRNVKAARLKRAAAPMAPTQTRMEAGQSPDSGPFTLPSSHPQDLHAAKMLISPPPEETLRMGRYSNSRARSTSAAAPTSTRIYSPDLSNSGSSKRKRRMPPLSSRFTQDAISFHDQMYGGNLGDDAIGVETTPNPKPRKQSKRNVSFVVEGSPSRPSSSISIAVLSATPTRASRHRASVSPVKNLPSPHSTNPNADYILPSPSQRHLREHIAHTRRSTTPLPPYEPPTERFTPPREVFYTPPPPSPSKAHQSSKRKTTSKQKARLTLSIKKEPPIIDLSQPPPPPSPTEDPLLLTGPPQRHRSRPSLVSTYSRDTPPLASTSPITEYDAEDSRLFDLQFDRGMNMSTSSMSEDTLPVPVFDLEGVREDDAGAWSDSDSDDVEFDQTGEYTGKFRLITVPTKEDPPSPTTRRRMEKWGRPISPFPDLGMVPSARDVGQSDVDAELSQTEDDETEDTAVGGSPEGTDDSDETLQLSADVVMDAGHAPIDSDSKGKHVQHKILADLSQQFSDLVVTDIYVSSDGGRQRELQPADYVPALEVEGVQVPEALRGEEYPESENILDEDETEEDFVDRELSKEPEPENDDDDATHAHLDSSHFSRPSRPFVEVDEDRVEIIPQHDDDAGSSDGSEILDEGVIRITSDDPLAAARAAAILKMHDYDCIQRIAAKKRRHSHLSVDSLLKASRRHSMTGARVTKHSSPISRRHTLGGIIGDKVIIPGSPSILLPDLLKSNESAIHLERSSLRSAAGRDLVKTPSRSSDPPSTSSQSASPASQEWTKADWKILDGCFTDERLVVGMSQHLSAGVLGDVDDVILGSVVDRYIEQIGGVDALAHRPRLQRSDILRRAQALQQKQRSGRVAPPTPISRQLSLKGHGPSSLINPNVAHLSVQERLANSVSQILPGVSTPKYSHLLEEALSVAGDTQQPSSGGLVIQSALPNPTLQPSTPSIAARMRGFLTSYLYHSPKPPPVKSVLPQRPSLPVPPPEVFEKPRQTIATPISKPAPRPPHPKDTVYLHPVPSAKSSMIPRVSRQPQRMVKLHPTSVEKPMLKGSRLRDRRSSGASVKDIIRDFESLADMDGDCIQGTKDPQLRRTRSVGKMGSEGARPVWRP